MHRMEVEVGEREGMQERKEKKKSDMDEVDNWAFTKSGIATE